jgi:D-3-phosphoglycerate dehydrogenase
VGRRPVVAILGTRYADLRVERELLAPHEAELRRGDGGDADAIVDVAGGADIIMCGSRPRFDAEVLGRLSCRAIVRYGIGVDSIDLEAARARGITVARVTDYGTEAVAFHAVALALAGLRRLTEANARVHAGQWGFAELRPLHLPSATTVGVVGYGRIGREAARRFVGLGFRVAAHDAFAPVDGQVDGVSAAADLDDLLTGSDVVTLHVPGTDEPLLGRDQLARMREGSVLVNTARGSLIDPHALVKAMQDHRPRIAALDVHAVEPPDLSIFAPVADRLIATPHMAWYTAESERDLREKATQEAVRILQGEPPHDAVVTPER